MASLLLWWNVDGAPIDDAIWARLVAQVALDAGVQPAALKAIVGQSHRALAVKTLSSEPEPLRHCDPDDIVLASLRHALSGSELLSSRLTEPAAVIRLEPAQRKLTLTRDLLGQRHLVWTRLATGYLVASREETLLAHPEVSRKWDLVHLSAKLAGVSPDDTSTPYAHIHAVAAGMRMVLTAEGVKTHRGVYEPCEDLGGWSRKAMSDRFRELLEASVQRATKGATQLGFSLSAGIDAASLAAIVMRHHGSLGKLPVAVCYGYARADGADLDERGPVRDLCRELGIQLDTFDASKIDLSFTLADGWKGVAASVCGNAYRELKSEVYRRLASHQVDVVIAGHGADQFTMLSANWMWSAWCNRDWRWLFRGVAEQARRAGSWKTLRSPSLRRFAKCLLQGRRGLLDPQVPHQIPADLRQRLAETRASEMQRLDAWPDPARAATHFCAFESSDYALECFNAEKYDLDIRSPYRDWELVRFVLSTPLHLSAGPIGYKWLQKQAVAPYLSETWLSRRKCGSLNPIFETQLDRWRSEVRELLARETSTIARFTQLPGDFDQFFESDKYRCIQLVHFLSWTRSHWNRSR